MSSMAGTMSSIDYSPAVQRITYPGKGPINVFSCCNCHHLRVDGNGKCPNCIHHGHCCVHCKAIMAPSKWSTNEVTAEYEMDLRRHQLEAQVPVPGPAVNYGDWVAMPQDGGIEEEQVRGHGPGRDDGPKHWVIFLFIIVILFSLDRSYQASKHEHQLAVLRAEASEPFKHWRVQRAEAMEELEETKRLLKALRKSKKPS